MGGGADGGLIHEIAAMPEAAAEREALLNDHGAEAHVGQVPGANEAGGTGAHDDHVAFDQLIEFLIVFARDLPGDIALAQGGGFWFSHENHSSADARTRGLLHPPDVLTIDF